MLSFQPVTLADKEIINRCLSRLRPTVVEQSFNTLFPWQQPHAYHWAVYEDWLLVRTTYQGRTSFLPPLGPTEPSRYARPLQELAQWAAAHTLPLVFSEVTKPLLELINSLLPGQFQTFSDRNAANYVYRIADLTSLSGKKYHAQKNLLNHFKRTYPEYQFKPLTPALLGGCRQALDYWCERSNCTSFPTLLQERHAIDQMFANWEQLDIYGVCISLAGRVEAFAIGEILNEDTVAILIEKANSEIKGLYSAINQMFLAEYWQDFTYVNRAEDLGLANLRRTKLAYLPAWLEMKYVLVPSGWHKSKTTVTGRVRLGAAGPNAAGVSAFDPAVRHPGPGDTAALQQLWRESFAEDREGPFVPWYFRRRYQPEDCWLLEQGGELAAMCFAPPVPLRLADNSQVEAPYIQGVATREAWRHKGCCRRLLAAVEAELRARQYPFGLLKPSDPAFYEPLGWRFSSYIRRYNLDFNQHFLLPLPTAEQQLRLEHYLAPAKAAEPAARVYQEWCRQMPACALREQEAMARLLEDHGQDGGLLLLAWAGREPLAYALYTATPHGLFIRELAFGRQGRRGAGALLRALAADYREDTPAAVLIMPDHSGCCSLLPQTLAGWQTLPFAMYKPLQMPAASCHRLLTGAYFYEYF